MGTTKGETVEECIVPTINPVGSTDDIGKDDSCWGPPKNMLLSLNSAYDLIMQNLETNIDKIWKTIWELKVPQRVRTLILEIQHGKIMTNVESLRRAIEKVIMYARLMT